MTRTAAHHRRYRSYLFITVSAGFVFTILAILFIRYSHHDEKQFITLQIKNKTEDRQIERFRVDTPDGNQLVMQWTENATLDAMNIPKEVLFRDPIVFHADFTDGSSIQQKMGGFIAPDIKQLVVTNATAFVNDNSIHLSVDINAEAYPIRIPVSQ